MQNTTQEETLPLFYFLSLKFSLSPLLQKFVHIILHHFPFRINKEKNSAWQKFQVFLSHERVFALKFMQTFLSDIALKCKHCEKGLLFLSLV